MNERDRIDVLKCAIVTLALRKIYRKGTEKGCARVHVPNTNFVKHLANGSLTTNQILAQSAQPFPRHGKGARTSARAHVQIYPTEDFLKRLANGSLTTYQISAQSVQPFPRHGNGEHTPPMTCVICIAAWSQITHQIGHNRLSYS